MPVTLRSYSKINLGLAIGPTRPDGFHALTTLYQTLEAHDLVTVSVEPSGTPPAQESSIALTSNDRRVPLDARNTVCKVLAPALGAPGREHLRVRVHIEKRLPIQGGLGGGSANAAAALLALERELAVRGIAPPLSGEQRLRLAAAVGSDVPLFLLGGTVLGLGRGEEVVPLSDLTGPDLEIPLEAVLALPAEGVSTPAAFRAWDAEPARGLTKAATADKLRELSRALASAWTAEHAAGVLGPAMQIGQDRAGTLLSTLVQTGILLNDFEQVVFRQHPLLRQIKRALAGEPAGADAQGCAQYAALSGSGSAVFGLYTHREAADAAAHRLNALDVRSLRTRTIGRAAYWSGMVVGES